MITEDERLIQRALQAASHTRLLRVDRLRTHLLRFDELGDRLAAAGCPSAPQQIGISLPGLRESYRQAYHIRRRFTVLDLAMRTGLFEPSLKQIFGPSGRWPIESASEPSTQSGGKPCPSN